MRSSPTLLASLVLVLLLGGAPDAGAVTLCAVSCPTDPSTPGPDEADWSFVLVLALAVGEDLDLDVDGDVYLFMPGGLLVGDVLDLDASDITLIGTNISILADVASLDAIPADCSGGGCIAGDVYVAIDPPFGELRLSATGQIFASDEALSFVPEPGAGALLLLALGAALPAVSSRSPSAASGGGQASGGARDPRAQVR